jgi:hypothetical protein
MRQITLLEKNFWTLKPPKQYTLEITATAVI